MSIPTKIADLVAENKPYIKATITWSVNPTQQQTIEAKIALEAIGAVIKLYLSAAFDSYNQMMMRTKIERALAMQMSSSQITFDMDAGHRRVVVREIPASGTIITVWY